MKKYKVVVTPEAYANFRRILAYLSRNKKNKQAAGNVMRDYQKTKKILSDIAGSIREPESEALKSRNLKRLNFGNHDYFLLFRIDGDKAIVTNIFHASEDFELKLF